jgi:subtilisin-like proprotein convertase family protein
MGFVVDIMRVGVVALLVAASVLLLMSAQERAASAGAPGDCSPASPEFIPDSDPNGRNFDCVITSSETISGLTVFLEIDHTWVGDLAVSLTHITSGTAISLIDRPGYAGSGLGCAGANILVTLDDDAAAAVEDQCAPAPADPTIKGTFRPNGMLSAFDGESLGGTWRLNISDHTVGDTGELVQWTMASSSGGADSDGDGCTDTAENQTAPGSEVSGGRRDPQNVWDFYDVPTGAGPARDGSVSGGDIFAVIGRFGTTGDAKTDPLSTPPSSGYHTAYDRGGQLPGQNVWNLAAANGSIAAPDIFGILGQFTHSCAQPG